jgi:hypothetical protein
MLTSVTVNYHLTITLQRVLNVEGPIAPDGLPDQNRRAPRVSFLPFAASCFPFSSPCVGNHQPNTLISRQLLRHGEQPEGQPMVPKSDAATASRTYETGNHLSCLIQPHSMT